MKKMMLSLVMAVCFLIPALAQQNGTGSTETAIWDHGDNVSAMTYVNVPVYQVMDHQDAYIVFYQKQSLDVGYVVIPKTWAVEVNDNVRKLQFRNKPKSLDSYMTVCYKDGQFFKVILTVSPNRQDAVWQVAPHGTEIQGADAQSLDFQY